MSDSGLKHDFFLDVSKELCPMTFVRVKVLLDTMRAGQVVKIILAPGEALNNVPASLSEHGYTISDCNRVDASDPDGNYQITVVKPDAH